MIEELLAKEKTAILSRWLERALEVYPTEARAFFSSQKNQFSNPVGQSLIKSIEAIFDCLLQKAKPEELHPHLFDIIRIRSVQELSPSQALSFLFLFKSVIRESLADALSNSKVADDLVEFEIRVDLVMLEAVNVYVECIKRIYELRVRETKRNVSEILKRTGYFETEDTDTNSK
jgi:hypothetical protein